MEQPIHTTEDRVPHDYISTNTNNVLSWDGIDQNHQNHHHFPPFSPDEHTHNDREGFRGTVSGDPVDSIGGEDVDFMSSNRPSNYYSADEIIARARLRVGGGRQEDVAACA